MITSEPQPDRRLIKRSMTTATTRSVKQMHQWGQYHKSRLSLHILAHFAYPEAPQALWEPEANASSLSRADLDLEALCAFAASLALRAASDDERLRSLRLFELVSQRTGGRVPSEYQDLHVTTAHLAGQDRRTKDLFKRYSDVTPGLAKAIRCQALHPINGGDPGEFIRGLKDLTGWDDLLEPEDSQPLTIDALRTATHPAVEKGPLISVIMTCYNPDQTLLTAVRSIQNQTWQNWELIIVDDGSGPEHADVLKQASGLDPRITVLVQPRNSGTYQARNRALAVAGGAFITGLDSDDWAHPSRLERQVNPMIDSPTLVMVETRSLSARTDLSLMIDPQIDVIATRSTPIMVRAKEVRTHIGFYDEVRKSADSEYRQRIRHHFGKSRWMRLAGGPLTIVRHADTTLSAGEVSRHWMSAGRLAYHSGFTHWHRRIAKHNASAFLEAQATRRPFPISHALTRKGPQNRARYDHVYAADWRRLDPVRTDMLNAAAEASATGLKIALLHCPDWVDVNGKRALIREQVLATAAEHGLDFIDPDTAMETAVTVPSNGYAELLRFEHPEIDADAVQPWTDTEPVSISFAPLPPVARRRLLTRADLALSLAGLASVAAVFATASIWQPESAVWALAAGTVAWAGACGAFVSQRVANRIRAQKQSIESMIA